MPVAAGATLSSLRIRSCSATLSCSFGIVYPRVPRYAIVRAVVLCILDGMCLDTFGLGNSAQLLILILSC